MCGGEGKGSQRGQNKACAMGQPPVVSAAGRRRGWASEGGLGQGLQTQALESGDLWLTPLRSGAQQTDQECPDLRGPRPAAAACHTPMVSGLDLPVPTLECVPQDLEERVPPFQAPGLSSWLGTGVSLSMSVCVWLLPGAPAAPTFHLGIRCCGGGRKKGRRPRQKHWIFITFHYKGCKDTKTQGSTPERMGRGWPSAP